MPATEKELSDINQSKILYNPPPRVTEIITVCSHRKPEKAMATHSSTLAWKIPWTEEPGRLQFMGSLRVGHD